MFGKRARAERANEHAGRLEREGHRSEAIREYERALQLDPEWSVPAYNLGLVYKYAGSWELSLEYNVRATSLAAEDPAGWWNLGIAATALGRWDVARRAWHAVGIDVPAGDGPIDFPCGTTPIRLHPEAEAEVVWSERLDPARAMLKSIPFPESGFRFGDVVLNDGAATGHRMLDERKVPVFDCLGLLKASRFSTWLVELEFDASSAANVRALGRLCELAGERELGAEDWSTTVRMLCKACSEGTPDAEHEHDAPDAGLHHRLAIAAPDAEQARRLLEDWRDGLRNVTVSDLRLVLNAGA